MDNENFGGSLRGCAATKSERGNVFAKTPRRRQHGSRGEANAGKATARSCLKGLSPFADAIILLLLLFSNAVTVQADAPAAAAPTGLWERSNLLGDMDGLRNFLSNYGVTFALSETSEVLGNTSGGVRRGADYDGLTLMSLSFDLDKTCGWKGGTFFASALQIHGRSLSADYLYNIQTASGIEAERTTRLWELWFQQAFAGDKASVRIGQQSMDQEFLVSQGALLYVNTMMGWPTLPSYDLYAGGPAYPLSSPAVRLKVRPNDCLTFLAGVFDDNPPGGPFDDDSQLRDNEASGTRFNMTTGALFVGEIQYALNPPPPPNSTAKSTGLPGTYKLGAWYDTAKFPDQRFDTSGLSLADPLSSGIARMDSGNFSIYGIADQAVWREGGGPRMLSVFTRLMGAPDDRNFIDWSLNAGVNVTAMLPGRDNDVCGIGYGWAQVSSGAAYVGNLAAGTESFIELTYQCQIAPWLTLQPDLQYVMNPGGGIADPLNPSRLIGNELVLGLRTIITF